MEDPTTYSHLPPLPHHVRYYRVCNKLLLGWRKQKPCGLHSNASEVWMGQIRVPHPFLFCFTALLFLFKYFLFLFGEVRCIIFTTCSGKAELTTLN